MLFHSLHQLLRRASMSFPLVSQRYLALCPWFLKDHLYNFLDWLADDLFSTRPPRSVHPRPSIQPWLEELRPRIVPAGTNWTGAVSTDWMTGGNWSNGLPTPTSDVVINNNATNAPTISANQNAICSTITDNGGPQLTIASTGSLEVTGQSGMGNNSTWNAALSVNGVLEVDNPGKLQTGTSFQWTGGNISGAESGTNPWGIYVCSGATWSCWQKAQNLGVSLNIGIDQLHNQSQTQKSSLYVSVAGANQLQQNLILNKNADITVANNAFMGLYQATNSAKAGGIDVDNQNSTSQITVESGATVGHPGDTNGQTLVIQPLVYLKGGSWAETSSAGISSINFSCQAEASQNNDGAVQIWGLGTLAVYDKSTVTAGNGIAINTSGILAAAASASGGTAQETINGNIYDNFGGNLKVGLSGQTQGWAVLTVNGNVILGENGSGGELTMWVQFDQNGNLSNYDRLSVIGQFAVNPNSGEWTSALDINTLLTNNVQPNKGQVINIVTATTTKTANPNPEAFTTFNWGGYTYIPKMTASGYQLTT